VLTSFLAGMLLKKDYKWFYLHIQVESFLTKFTALLPHLNLLSGQAIFQQKLNFELLSFNTQNVQGGKVNILGSHIICRSKQKSV
jgi:hypothetical protein